MIGKQVTHYRILARLGAGGMGEVFRAEDLDLGRLVALKFLHPELLHEPAARQRFAFEARTVAVLNHPHITTLYEFDAEEGFMSLEFVEGSTLEERLTSGALPPAEGVRTALAVCRALGHAHGRNVIHRDLKPSNILLGNDGSIKLTDFGVAKLRDSTIRTATEAVLGTAPYMCPEQIRGQGMDRRGDLFSLGVLLYRILAGRLPWSVDGAAALYAILHTTPPPLSRWNPDLPPSLSKVVERLLHKDPADRFPSAEEVEKHLAEIEAALSRGAHPPGTDAALAPEAISAASTGTATVRPLETGTAVTAAFPARLPLVGREREFTLLCDLLELARKGSGRTALIGGEAGLGKSRLIEEFRGFAEAKGLTCLQGRCSFRGGRNFEPFVEALEEYARRFGPEAGYRLEDDPSTIVPGSLFSTLNLLLDPGSAATLEPKSREQLWYVLDSLLKKIARHEPLVLILDDLHWADEGTLSLLVHVTRNLGNTRLLIVGAYRPEELGATGSKAETDATAPALEETIRLLSTIDTLVRVTLEPLSQNATARLLESALDDGRDGSTLAPTIFKRAQGNPFFTLEIVRLLSGGRGAAAGQGIATPQTAVLPQTVTDVLLRRLVRLTQEERDLLDLAAVEGESFHTELLEEGTGLPRIALLKRLRLLHQTHHLVAPSEEGHRFTHGMIREVLLREMPDELRREYHTVVAAHLTRSYSERSDYAGRIGYHLSEAHRFGEATPYLSTAAREARRLFLFDRALEFCERALDAQARTADSTVGRSELLHRKCEILLLLGRPEAARAAAAEALDQDKTTGETASRAASQEWLGVAALAQGDLATAEEALTQAREHYILLGDPATIARCEHELGALAARRGDFDLALDRLDIALASSRAAQDELQVARIRLDSGDVLYRRGDFGRALETFEAAVVDLRRLSERHSLARALNRQGNALFQSGHTVEALARYEEALSLDLEVGDVRGMAQLQANLGNVHLVRGDLERAFGSYQEALARFDEIGDRVGSGQIRMALGNVSVTRGEFQEAARHYQESVVLRQLIGDRWALTNSLDNLSVAEYYLGRWSEGLEHSQAAYRNRAELSDRPGRAESAMNLGNLLAVLGDTDAAGRYYAEADQLASELGDPRKRSRAVLSRACLTLWAGEREATTEALATLRSLGVEEPTVRSRALLLEALLEPQETPAASRILRDALAHAQLSGSAPDQALARIALGRAYGMSGRLEEAQREIDHVARLTGEGRAPLLELHALRVQSGLDRSTAAKGVERLRALVEQLSTALPSGLSKRPNLETLPFPPP